jgi:integrase
VLTRSFELPARPEQRVTGVNAARNGRLIRAPLGTRRVPGYTMHQLLDAAADDLRRATGSTAAAQMLLRHESVATTEAYLHPNVDDLRNAIRQLEGEECLVPLLGRMR